MEIITALILIILAFICEYLDCSLGLGYGTILAPLFLLFGINPLISIPSILISQASAGFLAAFFHHKIGNANFHPKHKDAKITLIIIVASIITSISTVFIAINIHQIYIEIYTGLLVVSMGIILLINRKFEFSWKKIIGTAILTGINKSLSASGNVVTSGLIISGNETKNSIAITSFGEAPICICGFIMYIILNGFLEPLFPIILTIGAVAATPFGAIWTSKFNQNKARKFIGILTVILGILTLIKLCVWF
ncbi:MAG: TSUP family transporter [Candidatus Lokiarchaeota archaeon]|nr:TSUP family transporter [Candidatus Lokiarchaeota archaeon]